MTETNTDGGSFADGNVDSGRDFVGRDQIFVTVINHFENGIARRPENERQDA